VTECAAALLEHGVVAVRPTAPERSKP